MDYRTYRLRNAKDNLSRRESLKLFHLMTEVDVLHPSLEVLDGTKTIRLLEFLESLLDVFDILGPSEEAAVRVLVYLLSGYAKDVLAEHIWKVELFFEDDQTDN